jgi:hypothetical protein
MLCIVSQSFEEQDIILEFALPLTMNYRQATRLDLVNSYSAKISYAALILRANLSLSI